MRDIKSEKLGFIDFFKKDIVKENIKRILFAAVVIFAVSYVYNYVKALPVKVDPNNFITAGCSVTDTEITVKIKEWEKGKKPELKPEGVKFRYDDLKRTLYVSLIISEGGKGENFEEFPIKNKFGTIKRVVVEGGILNAHQKTVWYDGEETIAVKPSPSPSGNKK